ncbi:Organic cation/carnitine transporter 7 [Dionaea muscipula]
MVDRVGRKLSMSSMFFLCLFFLFPLAFSPPESLTTPLLFGARVCITTTFTVVYVYAPEIYPTSVRTTGLGVASSAGRIGGMICPLVAISLVHGCHTTASIFLFELVVLISGVCVIFFPFETTGCELSDDISSLKLVAVDIV